MQIPAQMIFVRSSQGSPLHFFHTVTVIVLHPCSVLAGCGRDDTREVSAGPRYSKPAFPRLPFQYLPIAETKHFPVSPNQCHSEHPNPLKLHDIQTPQNAIRELAREAPAHVHPGCALNNDHALHSRSPPTPPAFETP